jgi:hypothetical protein
LLLLPSTVVMPLPLSTYKAQNLCLDLSTQRPLTSMAESFFCSLLAAFVVVAAFIESAGPASDNDEPSEASAVGTDCSSRSCVRSRFTGLGWSDSVSESEPAALVFLTFFALAITSSKRTALRFDLQRGE